MAQGNRGFAQGLAGTVPPPTGVAWSVTARASRSPCAKASGRRFHGSFTTLTVSEAQ